MLQGADYDKAGGESAGAGGGSGAYVSDKVFSVHEGETISYSIGGGGAAQNSNALKVVSASGGNNIIWIKCRINIYIKAGGGGQVVQEVEYKDL